MVLVPSCNCKNGIFQATVKVEYHRTETVTKDGMVLCKFCNHHVYFDNGKSQTTVESREAIQLDDTVMKYTEGVKYVQERR